MNKSGNDILLLLFDEKELLSAKATERNVDVCTAFKRFNSVFVLLIRKYYLLLRLPYPEIWFGEWVKYFKKNNYSIIIIHASNSSRFIADYISNYTKNRVIFWYWNPVVGSVDPNKVTNPKIEKWSFDKADCIKYNMKYNTQYYFENIEISNNTPEQDVFFVGADKGRLASLLRLEKQFNDLNITTYFHITPTTHWLKNKIKSNFKPRISYENVLQLISQSKSILDIVQENQSGLTLRPMEALMFSKKLITNDSEIAEYDFYHKNNIFILGKDNLEYLSLFINTPYHQIDDNIKNQYDFSNWILNFLN